MWKNPADLPQGLWGKAFTRGLSTSAKHRDLRTALRFRLHKEEVQCHRTRRGREEEQGRDMLRRLPISSKKSHCFKSQTLLSMSC